MLWSYMKEEQVIKFKLLFRRFLFFSFVSSYNIQGEIFDILMIFIVYFSILCQPIRLNEEVQFRNEVTKKSNDN